MPARNNIFAGPHLDRRGHHRRDIAWLEKELAGKHARFVPVMGSLNLMTPGDDPEAVLLDRIQAAIHLPHMDELIYLGRFHGHSCFTFALKQDDTDLPWPDSEFRELHRVGGFLPEDQASLLAYARGMVIWHRNHRFCGRCGCPSSSAEAGHLRLCTSPDCGRHTFPRVDPAIIVLVSDGNRCLLGRQEDWPEGRYSTIAGFVEPGESLEDAVAREIVEESGITVGHIRYHSSQPWPFPSSLMLGFTAVAETTEISLNDGELAEAHWFTLEEVNKSSFKLPRRVSIARRLVENWIAGRQSTDATHDSQ